MQQETAQVRPETAQRTAPGALAESPWGPWTALLVAVVVVALAMAGSTLLLHFGLIGGRGALPGDGIGLEVLMSWQAIVIILTLAAALRGGRPAATLALRPPAAGARAYLAALGIVLAFQVVATGLEYVVVPNEMFRDLKPFADLARGPAWWIGLLAVGIGAPISEELLFRGFLLPALAKSRLGFAGAALLTTTLWTLLHVGYTVIGLVEVFTIGLLFSWLLWRTGSLWVTIFCHAVYNSLIILALRFAPLPAGLLAG